MTNKLYPVFHEDNLSEFNRLLTEAEEFDENNSPTDEEDQKKDPAQMQEDDVFSKVKQENEQDVDTNAYSFLSRQPDGSFAAANSMTNQNDPAMKGLCNIITGDIMQNVENTVGYITALFNDTGLNDLPKEDFEKVKASIWRKLADITALDPETAYSTFQKFVVSTVNGIRENSDIDEPS